MLVSYADHAEDPEEARWAAFMECVVLSLDPGALLAGMLVSSIGFVAFMYGRKQSRPPHMLTGAVLMLFPIFVSNVPLILVLGALLTVLLWVAVRMGM